MAYTDEIKRLADLQKQQALSNLDQQKQASLSQLDQYKQGKLNDYLNSQNTGISQLDQYKNNQQTAYQNALNQSLSDLNAEQSAIAPAYYDKRNQTSTASQLQAKNFAEYLANRGLASSGTSAQSELARNVSLQNNIGSLNKQENAANQDVSRRKSDVNTTYNNNIQGLTNDYNLKLKSLQDAYNQNVLALNNEILGKTNDVNNQYQSGLNTQYAGIDANTANLLAQYQKQLDDRAYEEQQANLAYQRQQSLAKAKSSGSGGYTSNTKASSSSKPVSANFSAATQSASQAAKEGNIGAWYQANRDNLQTLNPDEAKALSPGGFIYHQLLKGD